MTKSYTADDIRKLKPMEQIRINPGMWIGPTEEPHHLIEEALDNSLDEAQGGYVSVIAINLDTKNNIYSILDNGRGIPLSKNVPITISTELFSGAKFQDNKTVYDISSGLNGVGLVCANALSDFYNVEVYRNGKHGVFNFKNGKLKKRHTKKFDGQAPFSTKIEFKPSKEIFESLIPDINRIKKRLQIASAEIPRVTFVLNIDDEREIFRMTIDDLFQERCIKKSQPLINNIWLQSKKGVESYNIKFNFGKNGVVTPKILSSVNLLPVDDGGSHVNWFYDLVRTYFTDKGKKLGYNFLPGDCLISLKAYLMLSVKDPKFAGQTKGKLTNRKETFDKFAAQIKTQLVDHFNSNEEDLINVLQYFQDYRTKLDSKKIKTAVITTGKRASTKFTKLRDCSNKNGELFITEGESAGGNLVVCRDPRRHAILPLKGKIPNAANTKTILQNKEIGELIGSFGTGLGPSFKLENLKYSKIICATDADDDGLHIFSLLTLAIALLTPEVIKEGRYFYAQTPLYAINEKNNFQPLWEKEELTKARNENKPILRIKGLGEMTAEQSKIVLINEDTRRLIPVTYSKDINKMIKLFTDSEEKRKLLDGSWEI